MNWEKLSADAMSAGRGQLRISGKVRGEKEDVSITGCQRKEQGAFFLQAFRKV